MKAVLYILISMMLLGIASASVGEYAGFLYFNFTGINQRLTNTWTLVNTGNAPVSFNVLLPSYNTSSFSIQTNVANGTIPANSIYPIQVSVTELSKSNFSFSGTLSAYFQGSGNIAFQIGKRVYVNFGNPSTTTTSVTTVPPTTIVPPSTTLVQQTTQSTTIQATTTQIVTQNKNSSIQSAAGGAAALSVSVIIPYLIVAIVLLSVVVCALVYHITKKKPVTKKPRKKKKPLRRRR